MAGQRWEFDPVHSSIGFWVRHLMVSKVHGRFTRWTGTLEVDEQTPSLSRVEVEIDTDSIDTKEQKRDDHLRSPDFLDAAKYPKLRFRSTSVEPLSEDRLVVRGELTIRDVTRPVELHVEYAGRAKDPWGGERAGFSARTSLNRKDFGLVWNVALEAGGVLVADKVDIAVEVEAIKAAAAERPAA